MKTVPEEIIQGILDFSRMKERIMFRLVHAEKNQERLRVTIHRPFLDLAMEFCIFGEGEEESDSSRTLYILSNKKRMYGAGCILYEGVLKEFSDQFKKDILILPSSVHEMLLIPDEGSLKITELEEMVESLMYFQKGTASR